MRVYYTYGLYLDKCDLPFYIGKTFDGSNRYDKHMECARRGGTSSRCKIIRDALDQKITIHERVFNRSSSECVIYDHEKELIAFYGRRDNGTGILCNHTDGGEGHSGHIKSTETRKRMSLAKQGKQHSSEWIMRRSKGCYKPIIQFTINDDFVMYHESATSAANLLGVSRKTIVSNLRGVSNTTSINGIKYRFKYEYTKTKTII